MNYMNDQCGKIWLIQISKNINFLNAKQTKNKRQY